MPRFVHPSHKEAVVGLDNFATGHEKNLAQVQASVGPARWENLSFKRGDIRDLITCHAVSKGVDYVLHQAALGSVPRSLEDPLSTHAANNTGFLNMLVAARDARVKRFVYAASSSTYGDHPGLPKVEDVIGKPLSPYAVTKLVNELYADVFGRCYGMESIGLRYFNIFGRRQDPNGAYAAVVPKWVASMIHNEPLRATTLRRMMQGAEPAAFASMPGKTHDITSKDQDMPVREIFMGAPSLSRTRGETDAV